MIIWRDGAWRLTNISRKTKIKTDPSTIIVDISNNVVEPEVDDIAIVTPDMVFPDGYKNKLTRALQRNARTISMELDGRRTRRGPRKGVGGRPNILEDVEQSVSVQIVLYKDVVEESKAIFGSVTKAVVLSMKQAGLIKSAAKMDLNFD